MAGSRKEGKASQKAASMPRMDVRAAKILLLSSVLALVAIGVVTVYSATSATLATTGSDVFSDVVHQLVFIGVGVLFMLAIWFAFPYQDYIGALLWAYYALCMVLVLLTFTMGTEVNGAKRWLYLFGVGIQPSEFAKVALLLMSIRIVYEYKVAGLQFRAAFMQFAVLVFLPLGFMLVTQSDFGTTAICFIGIYAVLWLGGTSGKWLVAIAATVAVLSAVFVFGVSYRSSRFVFVNPWDDGEGGLGAGYNLIHSYYAIAEGGLFGQGVGSSSEKYGYLFASDSDFIFAIIGEEMGLVGALAVIGLFILVMFCGLKIAADNDDLLGKMIAGGCVIMIVFQAFVNIGCAIGVFPTTGKPLPFISSGGSSVISSFILVGLVLSIARADEQQKDHERRRDDLRVVRNTRR